MKALNAIPFAFHNAKTKEFQSQNQEREIKHTQNTHMHKSIFIFFYFIRIWNRPNYFLTFKSCMSSLKATACEDKTKKKSLRSAIVFAFLLLNFIILSLI